MIPRRRALQAVWGCTTLPIVVGPDPRALSPPSHLLQRLTAEIVFGRGLTESDCAVGGPSAVMSSLCCWEWRALPSLSRAWILSRYATTTGGGDAGECEAAGTIRETFCPLKKKKKEIKRSLVCHGLGSDYTIAAPSPFLQRGARCPPP